MTILAPGDVVWVPFPRVETNRVTPRPALIVTHAPVGPDGSLVWALMITNAERADWPGDIAIADLQGAGLNHPSKIRTSKVATLEARSAHRLGSVGNALTRQVLAVIGTWLTIPHD